MTLNLESALTDSPEPGTRAARRILVRTLRVLKAFAVIILTAIAKACGIIIIAACVLSWVVVGGVAVLDHVFNIVPRVVQTASMVGTYDPGDIVWYLPPSGVDLTPGKVVAIAPNGDESAIYTHRIVSVEADGTATTAGDAFVGNGVVDVYHPTQADIRGVAFTATDDPVVKELLVKASDFEVRIILTALGLFTLVVWVAANGALNRRDRDEHMAFETRFNEMQAAMVTHGLISDRATRPRDGSPATPTTSGSTAESSNAKENIE